MREFRFVLSDTFNFRRRRSMTHAEQHKMILELKDFEFKMKGKDVEEFAMYVKRDKDDEDLDAISVRKLQEMHQTYVVRRKLHP
jgi:inorganic pyrophosphatase/exopolyphosphatase